MWCSDASDGSGGAEGTPFGGWALRFERGEVGNRVKLAEKMSSMPKHVVSSTLTARPA